MLVDASSSSQILLMGARGAIGGFHGSWWPRRSYPTKTLTRTQHMAAKKKAKKAKTAKKAKKAKK
jgi:hypothetical protein